MEATLESLEHECALAADEIVARHNWRLVDRLELARRGAEHVRAGDADTARRGVILAYSRALHRACSGVDGPGPQHSGYVELHRYLYEAARWRYADVAEEATQGALVRIYADFTRCSQPGAFLAFALHHLLNSARTARRERDRAAHRRPADGSDSRATDDETGGPGLVQAVVLRRLRALQVRLMALSRRSIGTAGAAPGSADGNRREAHGLECRIARMRNAIKLTSLYLVSWARRPGSSAGCSRLQRPSRRQRAHGRWSLSLRLEGTTHDG